MLSIKRTIVVTTTLLCVVAASVGLAWALRWGPFVDSAGQPSTPSATASATEPTSSPSASATQQTDTPAPSPSTSASAEPTTPAPGVTAVPGPGSTTATVVLTYASWAEETQSIEAGGYAAVVEETGTCTLTLTQGAAVRSQTIDALTDVSTMSCGGFLIPRTDLSTGTWSAVVSYASEQSSGQSDPVEVTVP